MPVPYMGSKRKSSKKIFSTIKNLNPDSNLLVDLFCGGFAISEEFLKNGYTVISNDKNKYVVELIKEAIKGIFNYKIFTPEFITREKFIDVINNPNNYDDWFVGYVQCIWSFGNSQKSYLFGKDVEPYKKAGHELVVNKNPGLIQKLINIPQKYIDGILKQDNIPKRRLALTMVSRRLKTRILELERLEQLEQLERLQQLEQLDIINLYSKDYREIEIPVGAIVYCDPPYKGTAEYKENGFNHDKFFEWARNISNTNKIYISEYNAPPDFKVILEFQQNSILCSGQNKNQQNEKLFTILK
jgi:site-specific DNA-adenine methylase